MQSCTVQRNLRLGSRVFEGIQRGNCSYSKSSFWCPPPPLHPPFSLLHPLPLRPEWAELDNSRAKDSDFHTSCLRSVLVNVSCRSCGAAVGTAVRKFLAFTSAGVSIFFIVARQIPSATLLYSFLHLFDSKTNRLHCHKFYFELWKHFLKFFASHKKFTLQEINT